MFGLKRNVLVFLIAAFVSSWIASLYFLAKFQTKSTSNGGSIEQITLEFAQKLGICLSGNTLEQVPGQKEADLFFIPILCFEAMLCSLAVAKAVHQRMKLGWSANTSTLDLLIRDSVIYFIVVFSTYLFNCLFWFFRDPRFQEIPVGFTVALPTIMIQRLLLNLRQKTHARTNLLTSYPVASHDISFLPGPEQNSFEDDR